MMTGMTAFVVLLRQVNVAGRNKVPMPKLRDALRAGRYPDASTYLANGNVVLSSPASAREVAAGVHECISSTFGKDVVALARTADQVTAALDGCPFPRSGSDDVLHVGFFDREPEGDAVDGLKMLVDDGLDALALEVVGTELYLRYSEEAGGRMSPSALERALGVRVTTRSWRTVEALVEMAGRLS